LIGAHAALKEARTDLQSNVEHARQVVLNLQTSMQEWRWISGVVIHPYFLILRLFVVLSLKFHLYLGKEIVVFLVNQFLESRGYADAQHWVNAHSLSSASVGRVEAVSGCIKEAALSLGARFPLGEESGPLHPLAEVVRVLHKEHPELLFDVSQPSPWQHPAAAWQDFELRCQLSGVSLPWCLQTAKHVTPEPSARALFSNAEALENELLDVLKKPYIVAPQNTAGAAG
jgi:hypothetical protein